MDIDLDNIHATKLHPEVLEAMLPFLQKRFKKRQLASLHEEGLNTLYTLAGANFDDHMVFTSSYAEAVNHIIFSTFFDVSRTTGKNHFITPITSEAPPILAMSRLAERGAFFDMIPVNEKGIITTQALLETITPRTALLSISLANGLTGVLQPIFEIVKLCKEREILLHIDATHIVGKRKISFNEWDCDFLTINGEMLHAPVSGLLFIKKEHLIAPMIMGGNEQGGLRGGSYNTASFFGLVQGAKMALDSHGIHLAHLRDLFEEKLSEHSVVPLFKECERVPHISSLHFPKVSADALLYFLQKKNLFASQGGGNFQKIPHLLKASNLFPYSSLSFSFSEYATPEMVTRASKVILDTYLGLKKELELYE